MTKGIVPEMTGDHRRKSGKKTRVFISRDGEAATRYSSGLSWEPPADVVVTSGEVIVVIDIAGMDSDSIEIVTDGDKLRIGGVRGAQCCEGDLQYNQIEISIGRFYREIDLPVPIDSKKTSARYERGMLEVRIGRADPRRRTRKVKID
jgi:HSP20 family protein